MSPVRTPLLSQSQAAVLKAVAAVGALAFFAGLYWAPDRAWGGLLWGNFYFLSAALAGAVFICLQYVSSAGWSAVLRRVPEAMTAYLPVGLVLMAALLVGLHDLYPWAYPGAGTDDVVLRVKAPFLSAGGFAVLLIVVAAAWLLPVRALLAHSREQDADGDPDHTRRCQGIAAGFLVLFALTFTAACVQWIMSLEPHWYSTIYSWYVFAGLLVAGIAGLILLLVAVRRTGTLTEVNAHHFHDLGKLLFALSSFWAYLWFCQGLLIWYSNIPEETTHFAARLAGGWRILFWINPVVNFIIPFALLLSAKSKKTESRLAAAAVVVLLGHALDLYLLIMPPIAAKGPAGGWFAGGIFLGLAAVFVLLFDRSFNRHPAMPLKDPYLQESLHHAG
jgi:hypothetical protein